MVARSVKPSGVASYAATLCAALVKGGHEVLFAHGVRNLEQYNRLLASVDWTVSGRVYQAVPRR